MLPDIDLSKIRHHRGSQDRAFEELCYQLIPTIEGIANPNDLVRHGTPDGGVEFLWHQPDDTVWAWQAKFFFKLGDSQFAQIEKSIKQALASQPRLTRYVVCLPYDRPAAKVKSRKSAMQKWAEHVEKWTKLAKGMGINLTIDYLGESQLLKALIMPEHAGQVMYWFNTTLFTSVWFERHVESALQTAEPRYSPDLNVDLPIAQTFDGLGRTAEFETRLKTHLRTIRERRRWSAIDKNLPKGSGIAAHAASSIAAVDELDAAIVGTKIQGEHLVDFDGLISLCGNALDKLSKADRVASNEVEKLDPNTEEDTRQRETTRKARDQWRSAGWQIRRTMYAVGELDDLLRSDVARLVNTPAMLLTGRPGTGKTHLLCDLAKQRNQADLPTIVLFGNRFVEGEPWRQIINELHIDCTVDQLLAALEVAAQAHNTRALILIDAINEGAGLSVWPKYLTSLISKLRKWPRLGIVLSCRTSYVSVALPPGVEDSLVTVEHHGFVGHEYQAARAFFGHFKLTLPDFPLLLPEFQNPLFLKLICQGLRAQGRTTLPRGAMGVTWLFNEFLAAVEKDLATPQRIDLPPGRAILRKALRDLAAQMSKEGTDSLPFEQATDIIDAYLPGHDWTRSLSNALIAEGILMQELPLGTQEGEVLMFAYQRLGNHLQASELYADLETLDELKPVVQSLASDQRATYRNSGLLEALAVLIPEQYGIELHELLADQSLEPIQHAYLESLIWRDLKAFPSPMSFDYLNRIGGTPWGEHRVLDTLLHVACVPEHPLNAEFLHSNLWRRSMTERDGWWSTYVHWNSNEGMPVTRLIDWAWSDDTTYASDHAALLAATALSWYLTTPNRFVRDKATKALVALLTDRPAVLNNLLKRFHNVNDPYIAERLYAVSYGCAMRSTNKAAIGRTAKLVYSQVFESGRPPIHVLLRDYARGVVERAAGLGCALGGIDLSKARPPYESPWPVTARSEERLKARYYDDKSWRSVWTSVMSWGDFNRYVIEPAVTHFLAPNQRAKRAAARKQAQAKAARRSAEFFENITTTQTQALTSATEYSDLEKVFSKEELIQLAAVLRDDQGPRSDLPITFDLKLAARWIFSRVVSLGWTPERFAQFDDFMAHSGVSRTDPKAERFGKKYQWIALHELIARIADHCTYLTERWSTPTEPYDGPWQLWLRDIDPSLTAKSTGTQRWFETSQNTWWSTSSPQLPEQASAAELDQWLQRADDLPDPAKLLLVEDDAGDWLVLESYNTWSTPTPPEDDPYEVDRPEVWYHVRSYFVRTAQFDKLRKWAKATNWMGRWMPESLDSHKMFLGEYTWHHSAAECTPEWAEPESFRKGLPVPILVTASRYRWEGGTKDCSIDDTVAGIHPSLDVLAGIRAQWHGKPFSFEDESGRLLALDPTSNEPGPAALLVRRQELFKHLGRNGFSMIWTILGEKRILSRNGLNSGRLELFGAYSAHDGAVRRLGMGSQFVPSSAI